MLYESPELTIEVGTHEDGSPQLRFSFKGKFTEKVSIESTRIWDQFLSKSPNDCHFIWDCNGMTGFELSARKEWYRYLSIHKQKIKHVSVLSNSIMIRSAARVMLELFGVPFSVNATPESKLKSKTRDQLLE